MPRSSGRLLADANECKAGTTVSQETQTTRQAANKGCLILPGRVSSLPMEKLVIGLWGWYFGTTVLMLAGAALAFSRSLRRVSINAAVAALASAFFVMAFLGGLPISDNATLARFLAHVGCVVAVVLAFLLLAMLGVLRLRQMRQSAALALGGLCVIVLGVGWMLEPLQALALSTAVACLLGVIALGVCLRSALRGDRLALAAVAGVLLMLIAIVGLSWIALDRQHAPRLIHVVSAVAATLYLWTMALAHWSRYAHLIELHEVMAHGPNYDPVTRMRSHAATGQIVTDVFKRFREAPAPMGLIVLSIANLYTLDKLYGSAAVNSALFICAGRLRRAVPAHIEMGRLGSDGFLLLMPNCGDSGRLMKLARSLESRLRKSVALSTGEDASRLETGNTRWVAEIGVGVMIVSNSTARGTSAVAMARGLSRTAMSYASRIAWFDHSGGGIVELPLLPSE